MVLMMVLFFHAARIALVAFDPYFSSRQLAEALVRHQGRAHRRRSILFVFVDLFLREP